MVPQVKNELFFGIISFCAVGIIFLVSLLQYNSRTKNTANTFPAPSTALEKSTTTLTLQVVTKHSSASDCWLIIENKVYDVTNYLSQHPGGGNIIIPYCGKEATQAFATQDGAGSHSKKAYQDLTNLYIGDLNSTMQQAVSSRATNTNILPKNTEKEVKYEDD